LLITLDGVIRGDAENARPENDGQRKLWVWKMQDWKMTDKLAGTRVSVLSVLTLWPLCQMAVRCVVDLLTWLCVCIFDVYLANNRKTLLELD